LKYAHRDIFGGWQSEWIDSADESQPTSLVLDPEGYPHISYCQSTDLKYAYQNTAGWHIETVDSEGEVGYYTSLAWIPEDTPVSATTISLIKL